MWTVLLRGVVRNIFEASELVAAYAYAQKRTMKSMTISLSTLEGAASAIFDKSCIFLFTKLAIEQIYI